MSPESTEPLQLAVRQLTKGTHCEQGLEKESGGALPGSTEPLQPDPEQLALKAKQALCSVIL